MTQLAEGLRQAGVPEGVVNGFIAAVRAQHTAGPDGVGNRCGRAALGHQASDAQEFLAANKARSV